MLKKIISKSVNLKDGEEIRSIVRKSLWTYFWWILLVIILVLLPFFLMYFLFQQGLWGIIVFFFLLLVGIIFIVRIYLSYYLTVFILTNMRVIDIDQKGFFSKTFTSALYDKVQDVSCRSRGILKTIFRLGDVYIDLTGKRKTRLKLTAIKHPQKIVNDAMSLQADFLRTSQNNVSKSDVLLEKIKRKLGEEKFNQLIND